MDPQASHIASCCHRCTAEVAGEELLEGLVLVEAEVRQLGKYAVDLAGEIVTSGHASVLRLPARPVELDDGQSSLIRQAEQTRQQTLDEFGAKIDRHRPTITAQRVDATADAVSGFQQAHRTTSVGESRGGRQARYTVSDDQDVACL